MPCAAQSGWIVACFCAAWCDSCTQYREKFDALARSTPGTPFAWIDIEDHPDYLGEEDVENFPTLVVQHAGRTLFFGPMLPHIGHLERLIQALDSSSQALDTTLPDIAALLSARSA